MSPATFKLARDHVHFFSLLRCEFRSSFAIMSRHLIQVVWKIKAKRSSYLLVIEEIYI